MLPPLTGLKCTCLIEELGALEVVQVSKMDDQLKNDDVLNKDDVLED